MICKCTCNNIKAGPAFAESAFNILRCIDTSQTQHVLFIGLRDFIQKCSGIRHVQRRAQCKVAIIPPECGRGKASNVIDARANSLHQAWEVGRDTFGCFVGFRAACACVCVSASACVCTMLLPLATSRKIHHLLLVTTQMRAGCRRA